MKITYIYRSIYQLVAIATLLVIYSCASTGNPSGGPRDKTPPKVLTEKSTPNQQTNFEKQEIEFNFDEFVNLKNPLQQVVISPPLIYPLQFDHRGKRIRVKFHENEELKEDVTYSISFGEAIEDFREGNKLENFKFVFSTGDELDSLTFSGSVLDAYTREPAKDILVMLYDTIYRDSIPYQDRPYYFAKTDEEGKFLIENMKSDTFKIFALGDANLNYVYDQDSELIGFTDSLYIINESIKSTIELEVFLGKSNPLLYDVNTEEYGVVRLEFDQSPEDVAYTVTDENIKVYPQVKADSLLLWYTEPSDTLFTFYILEDTINVNTNRYKKSNAGPIEFVSANANLASGIMSNDSIKYLYNHPLGVVDTSLIQLYYTNDTLQRPLTNWSADIVDNDPYSMFITYRWSEKDTISISVDSAAVKDIFGNTIDSSGLTFKIEQAEKRGIILFELTEIEDSIDYLIEIRKGDKITQKLVLTKENNSARLAGLKAGIYNATIIEDINKNRRWDAGDYLNHRQSEVIRTVDIEELRENWEVEAKVNWSKVKSQKRKAEDSKKVKK